MNERVKLPIPEGALLPAEERLQNVLKAIEDRLRYEKGEWEQMLRELDMGIWTEDSPELAKQRSFIQGLDIAWSLAKTEILRRGRCASKFTRAGLLPGLNECELDHGHENLHRSNITGGFCWSDTDAD